MAYQSWTIELDGIQRKIRLSNVTTRNLDLTLDNQIPEISSKPLALGRTFFFQIGEHNAEVRPKSVKPDLSNPRHYRLLIDGQEYKPEVQFRPSIPLKVFLIAALILIIGIGLTVTLGSFVPVAMAGTVMGFIVERSR